MLFIEKLNLITRTSWKQILEQLIVPWAIKQFSASYAIGRLIIIFTLAHHMCVSLARWIQPITPILFLKVRSNIFWHVCIGAPSSIFFLVYWLKFCCEWGWVSAIYVYISEHVLEMASNLEVNTNVISVNTHTIKINVIFKCWPVWSFLRLCSKPCRHILTCSGFTNLLEVNYIRPNLIFIFLIRYSC
jgi:hypothetical protein